MWNDAQKIGAYLNSEAGSTKRFQAPLFSPIFSGKTEKIGPSETTGRRKSVTTSQSASLTAPLEGEPRDAHRRKYSKAGDDLSVSLRLPAPLEGEPCGEKSPPRGARGLLFTVSVWFYPQNTLS